MLNFFKLLALSIIIIGPVNTTVACSLGNKKKDNKPEPQSIPWIKLNSSTPVPKRPFVPTNPPNYPSPSGQLVSSSDAHHVQNSNLYNIMTLNPSASSLNNNFKKVRQDLLNKLKLSTFTSQMQNDAKSEGIVLNQKADPQLVTNFENNLWNKNYDGGTLSWQQGSNTLTQRLDLLSNYITSYNSHVSLDFNSLFKPANFKFNKTVKENYQAGILKFYNFLFNYLGPINTSHLLKSFNGAPKRSDGVVGVNSFSVSKAEQKITFFGDAFANQTTITNQYRGGWWATNNLLEVFVHEVGHAIANFLYIAPSARIYFNSDPTTAGRLMFNSVDPNNYINDYLGKAFNHDSTDKIANALDTYAIVPSNYGRSASYGSSHFPEVFAESFAQWLLPAYANPTSEQGIYDHTYSWSLVDSFYNNALLTKFNLTNQ